MSSPEDMDDNENLTALWNKHRKGDHTAKGRRGRELRSLSYADRRAMRGQETKSAQLNLKVTPTLKSKIVSMALREKLSMAELIEKWAEQYGEQS